MADSAVFDSVFRTMTEKTPELVIPLINEAFGRDFPLDEPFEQYRNEHETPGKRIITDSFFKVRGLYYHIECQSTDDAAMAIRMIEYDFAIALEGAIRGGAPYRMRFPESCVLYLRNPSTLGDSLQVEVELPQGKSFVYEARIMRAQGYGGDEIFAKRLLMLLPYYIMRYEGRFDEIAGSEDATNNLLRECESLRQRLENVTVGEDRALLYEHLVELSVRVSDYMLSKQEGLRRKVRQCMGGEILELMSDRIAAAEREAVERGLKRGIEQGRSQLATKLEELGVDKELIAKALAEAEGDGK